MHIFAVDPLVTVPTIGAGGERLAEGRAELVWSVA